MTTSLKLENGEKYTPDKNSIIHCETHNVTVRWGDLDDIQKLAVAEGIDIAGKKYILSKKSGLR